MSVSGGDRVNDYAFGNFLCNLRTEKGLSQTQLGEMLGVTNKAVSKWENGSAKPNTSLLPKIAEILGVTIEELFACKRIEQVAEYENLRNYLCMQKRKSAFRTSLFLSLIITLPLFLFDFIFVMASFAMEDEIVGPLGSVAIIISFIISVTAYIIHRSNFRRTITPDAAIYDSNYVSLIQSWIVISVCVFLCLFVVLTVACSLLLSVSSDDTAINIIFSVIFVLMTVTVGIFVCCQSLKRLHRINVVKKRLKIKPFKQWPLWSKICYILSIVFFVFSFCVLNFDLLSILARALSVILLAVLYGTRRSRSE